MPIPNRRIWSTVAGLVMLATSAVPARTLARSRTPAPLQGRAHVLNRWENVAGLSSGMQVRVAVADGSRISGTLQSVSGDQLVIQPKDGTGRVAWLRDQVARVEQRQGPRVRSGAGWGALVGVLVGGITLGTIEPKDAVTDGVLRWHEVPVLATTTAVGAGAGSVINLARRRWVVVYQSP